MRVFWIIGVFFFKPCQLQLPLSLASWWLEVETALEKFLFVWLTHQNNRYATGALILLLSHCVGQLRSHLRASSLIVPPVDDTLFDQVDTCQCSAVALYPHMKTNTDWNPLSFFLRTSPSNSLWLGCCKTSPESSPFLPVLQCPHTTPPSVSLPFALCLCYPSIMRLLELICLNVFHETYPVLPDLPGFPAVLKRAKLFLVLFKPDALWSGLLPFLFWTVWPCFVPHTHLTIATLFLFFQPLEQAFSQHPGVASFINVQVSPQVSPSPLSYLKLQFILSLSSYFLHSPHSYFPSFGLPPLMSTLTVYLRGWQIGVGQIKLLALHVKFCWRIAWSICL